MAKAKTVYRCTECGAEFPKWAGRCESCDAWNTLGEEMISTAPTSKRTAARSVAGIAAPTVMLGRVTAADTPRWTTQLNEFDFVLGGGLVPGSMVLVGGEPGIGKTRLIDAFVQALGSGAARLARGLVAQGIEQRVADRVGTAAAAFAPLASPETPSAAWDVFGDVQRARGSFVTTVSITASGGLQ